MNEDEYWASDPEWQDEDIDGDYLIEDYTDDDITLVLMPQVKYDFDSEFETYYKMLKKCRNKEQMKNTLREIINHAQYIALLEHESKYLQDRAKDLEFTFKLLDKLG